MKTDQGHAPGTFALAMLAWVVMLGLDFLLHGGLLARFYATPGPFVLSAGQAFRRIPFGYLAFLLLAILLAWLMRRLAVRGARAGAMFGLQLGVMVWGAFALGLWSISTAEPELLAAWFAGQSAELAVAGGFMGSALAGTRLSKLFWIAAALLVVCGVITVTLQSLGFAPAVRIA